MSGNTPKDTVNRAGLMAALIPFILSLGVLGVAYFYYYVNNSEPETITISAGRPGSPVHELIETIAHELAAQNPDIKVRVIPSTGAQANIRLLESGRVDIAAIPSDTFTRPGFALIANLFPDIYHLVVHADSGIRNVNGLSGKRIAVPPVTSNAYRSFWFLIGQYGVNPESILAKPMGDTSAFNAIRHGLVDALFYTAPPANKRTRWIAEAARIKILDIDQAAAMTLRRQSLEQATIPKGIYGGEPAIPANDIKSVAVQRILITRKDFSQKIVNTLTRILFENRKDLAASSRLANFITKPSVGAGTLLPVHPGAESFYNRDQPSFLQQNAEVIGVLFSILIVLFSGLMWLKRRWEERLKGRIDVYNLELVDLTSKARNAKTQSALDGYRKTLFEMLERVIRDLDEDNIDGNGFHYFAFTWQAALTVIAQKERDLAGEHEKPEAP